MRQRWVRLVGWLLINVEDCFSVECAQVVFRVLVETLADGSYGESLGGLGGLVVSCSSSIRNLLHTQQFHQLSHRRNDENTCKVA